MSNSDTKQTEELQELRRHSRELRQVPGNRKGNMPDTRRQELATVVARAVTGGVPVEELERELPPFPPQVIGRALASVWSELEPNRRVKLIARLKAQESERLLGEALPMAAQLLKTPATAAFGAEVLAMLPTSEKTAQRVAAEILGEDGIPMSALKTPDDDVAAAGMFRVLLKAAVQDKAQPFRRLQLLRLALPWLESKERHRDSRLQDIISQARQLPRKITGPAADEWTQSVSNEAGWSRILGVEPQGEGASPGQPVPSAANAATAISPRSDVAPQSGHPVTSPVSAGQSSSQQRPTQPHQASTQQPPAQQAPELSLEDARSTLQSLRDRRMREARALDRVLGALRASEHFKAQSERDVQEARERARKSDTERDQVSQKLDQLRTESETLGTKLADVKAELSRKETESNSLTKQLADEHAQVLSIRAEHDKSVAAWKERETQLETQVIENAKVRVAELGKRLAGRLERLLADVPKRSADMKGDGTAAVLHTRIHEFLDLLRSEGIPVRSTE